MVGAARMWLGAYGSGGAGREGGEPGAAAAVSGEGRHAESALAQLTWPRSWPCRRRRSPPGSRRPRRRGGSARAGEEREEMGTRGAMVCPRGPWPAGASESRLQWKLALQLTESLVASSVAFATCWGLAVRESLSSLSPAAKPRAPAGAERRPASGRSSGASGRRRPDRALAHSQRPTSPQRALIYLLGAAAGGAGRLRRRGGRRRAKT